MSRKWMGSRFARAIAAFALLGALVVTVEAPAFATSAKSTSAISAKRCATNRAAGPITFVSPFAFDASPGILDVFAASSLGYFQDLCLTVKYVTSSFTAPELVAAGRGTITGEGSAADALTAMANDGNHLTAIATFGNTSDYALLTGPSIKKLTDLKGKTLGYHAPIPVVLTEMLARAHVSGVKEVAVGYNPNVLPEGKVQALQAYRTNEPITLSAEHHAYREWLPSSFGVSGTFNVQVVNSTFAHLHAATTADFLRAELHAFDYCAKHEAACVKIEQTAAKAANQPFDYAHELAEWQLEVTLVEHHTLPGAGIGTQSTAEWAPEAQALRTYHIVKTVPSLQAVENTAMIASLYKNSVLRWPGA